MSESQIEMEQFLQEMKVLYEKEPQHFNTTTIYRKLIQLGVYANELHTTTRQWYPIWEATFQKCTHLDLFNTTLDSKFFQIRNIDTSNKLPTEQFIKLYLPVHRSHFNQCVQRLFLFLDQQIMYHDSKIRKTIANDAIVVRVTNTHDVDKITNFIQNDSLFKSGLIKPNPFTMNNGVFSITKDGHLSYNSVVSAYIEDYIKQETETVTLSRFYQYLNLLYKKTFIEGYDLSITAYLQHLDYNFSEEEDYYKKVYDCKYITEILLKVVSGNQLYQEDFLPIYQNSCKEGDIDRLRKFYRTKEASYHEATYYLSMCIEQNIKLQGLKNTMNALKMYIEEQNPNGFTKKENIRNTLLTHVPISILSFILDGLTPEDYVMKEAYNLGLMKEEVQVDDIDVFMDDLIKGLILTYEKYLNKIDCKVAHEKIIEAVLLIQKEDFSYITKDKQVRKKLMLSSKKVDLKYLDKIIYQYLLEATIDVEREEDTMNEFATFIEDLYRERVYPLSGV